jgi:mRNA interferase RelE/StbE
VEIMPAAERDLHRLPRGIRDRVDARLRGFADEPRPYGARHLAGSPFWRIRVGDYRIIFTINDQDQVVTIARIRHRGDVYRGL